MTTSFGAFPVKDANGLVTVGTTEDDIQKIYGSLYTAGLISGGVITRSATALTYTVGAGVAAFPLVVDASTPYKPQNQKTVLGPIPTATLTVTAPSSGTRTDIIYAQQLTPTDDSDANVVVRVGQTLPARAVLLQSFLVSSTHTNSLQATQNGNIKYSIPYGASMGRLATIENMFNSTFDITPPGVKSSLGTKSFYIPTDRLVNVSLTVAVSANGAVGFDNSKYCEAGYDVLFNGWKKFAWSTMGLHQAWQEINWTGDIVLTAGNWDVSVLHYRATGPGTPRGRASAGAPYGRLYVTDIGPVA